MGLIEAVKGELAYLHSLYHVKHHFDYPAGLPRFDSMKELNIFRIVQEALNNVARHAKAGFVSVKICYENKLFLLAIRDNGRGWDLQAANANGGMGIAGMKKRAGIIHGELTIQTAPGEGTYIGLKIEELQNGQQPY